MTRKSRIVLTGAGGVLGSYLREPLAALAEELVSTDLRPDIGELLPNERYVPADLSDAAAVAAVLEGADMVVHFGARAVEAPFDAILSANIIGAYNLWSAAQAAGVKRIVYASSIHTVGMYRREENIGVTEPHRPDSFYGLSKCFGEDIARLYWDKHQIEAVCLRIYSCAPLETRRGLGGWLSYRDLVQLVEKSLTAQVTGFTVAFGISGNTRAPVQNDRLGHLGYAPQDDAEREAARIFAATEEEDALDPGTYTLAGWFATSPLGEEMETPPPPDGPQKA